MPYLLFYLARLLRSAEHGARSSDAVFTQVLPGNQATGTLILPRQVCRMLHAACCKAGRSRNVGPGWPSLNGCTHKSGRLQTKCLSIQGPTPPHPPPPRSRTNLEPLSERAIAEEISPSIILKPLAQSPKLNSPLLHHSPATLYGRQLSSLIKNQAYGWTIRRPC